MSKVSAYESGTTAIEYSLIAAGISVVISAAVKSIDSNLAATFESIADAMKGASGGGGSN